MSTYVITKSEIGSKDKEVVTSIHYPFAEVVAWMAHKTPFTSKGTIKPLTFPRRYLAVKHANELATDDTSNKYMVSRSDRIGISA